MKPIRSIAFVLLALLAGSARAHTVHIPDVANKPDCVVVAAGETFTVEGELRVDTLLVYPGGTLVCRPRSIITILDRKPTFNSNPDLNQLDVGVVNAGNWTGDGFEVRSENPNGNRGHVLITGHGKVEISNCKFTDLGRTTNAPLDELTNKIGRYALHFHHFWGVGRVEDFEINRSPKWGLAIHGSHFLAILRGVIRDCLGSGLVFEDFTAGNLVEDIEIIGSLGNGVHPLARNGAKEDFGYEGAGLWVRGVGGNTIRRITVRRCHIGAMLLPSNLGPRTVRLPSRQGVDPDGPEGYTFNTLNIAGHGPIDGLVTEDCEIGFEMWNFFNTGVVPKTLANSRIHATQRGINTFFIHRFILENTEVDAPIGFIHQANADNIPDMYSHALIATGCKFKGETGVAIRPRFGATILDTEFDCETSIKLYRRHDDVCDFTVKRCTHTGRPLWVEKIDWSKLSPRVEPSWAVSPARILWEDQRLYHAEQVAAYVGPPSLGGLGGSPEPGLTNAELQSKYGVSTLGYIAPAEAKLDERFGLWAVPAAEQTLSPPPRMLGNASRERLPNGDARFTFSTDAEAKTLLALTLINGGPQRPLQVTDVMGLKHVVTIAGQPKAMKVIGLGVGKDGALAFWEWGNVIAAIEQEPDNSAEIQRLKDELTANLSKDASLRVQGEAIQAERDALAARRAEIQKRLEELE